MTRPVGCVRRDSTFVSTSGRESRPYRRQDPSPALAGGDGELQLHHAGRAVALSADDPFGAAVGALHLAHPFDVLVGAGTRLLVLM
jgi:hypothetical protein